jgi:hypothetical protein
MGRRSDGHGMRARVFLPLALIIGTCAGLSAVQLAAAQQERVRQQRTFDSPEDAVIALVSALRSNDLPALADVLGPASPGVINSGDAIVDKDTRNDFVAAYDMKWKLVPINAGNMSLEIGNDGWPFPIPLVRAGSIWRFDTDAGRDEILNRRIGRNETNAIEASLAFVDAQREYASVDHDGDSILEYAQRIRSSPNKKDGLYWPVEPGERPSPLGPLFASAQALGYGSEEAGVAIDSAPTSRAYYGYYYKILNAQGPAAPGGAYAYIVGGDMIGGVGLIAYPVSYGTSGIMSFIVNHDGIVYQKDLGPETLSVASTLSAFSPDETWQRAQIGTSVARAQ